LRSTAKSQLTVLSLTLSPIFIASLFLVSPERRAIGLDQDFAFMSLANIVLIFVLMSTTSR
jgi:hypothetical protein